MAVANLTEVSNSVIVANLLSAKASPALVKAAVGLNSLYRENLPSGTNLVKFVKRGSLTAASLAESTALAADANGELTDSSVSATAAKCAVSSGLSIEGERFSNINVARLADEHGSAIGRYVSNDIIGMAAGLATTVTSTSVMTIDDIMLGQYNIFNSNVPNQEVPLHAFLGPKAHYNIKKELIQSGASAWNNPGMLSLLQNLPSQAGYVGSLPGLGDFYVTTGFATTGGDDQQMIVHPMWCLAGIFDSAPITWFAQKGPEGFYTSVATCYLYDVIEWNDLAGVMLRSDT
jgi:hypothetical protein